MNQSRLAPPLSAKARRKIAAGRSSGPRPPSSRRAMRREMSHPGRMAAITEALDNGSSRTRRALGSCSRAMAEQLSMSAVNWDNQAGNMVSAGLSFCEPA